MGERPFSGNYAELKKFHLNQKVDVPTTVPFLLRSVIVKALQKLPQRRFNSAAEMLKSIQLATSVGYCSRQHQWLVYKQKQVQQCCLKKCRIKTTATSYDLNFFDWCCKN